MKRLMGKPVLSGLITGFILLLLATELYAVQKTVTLEQWQWVCDTPTKTNRKMIENAVGSDTVLQLPEGKYSTDALLIKNVSNFTLQGATTVTGTQLVFQGSSGATFSNTANARLESLTFFGAADANLVLLKDGGSLKVKKYTSVTSNDASPFCLAPKGGSLSAWVVPTVMPTAF